ncbi:hypothetical protein [Pseudonocardia sp. GCM10023141]|uniref:hypothetical protein n=1 Tax=Pseudonocardia sp. GCM10023141 TaxID=3252653 RepID=UPI00360A1EA7
MTDWPQQLAGAIGTAHDLSWWDVRSARASTYDVRRVQLRAAVAHRPHLVALASGLVDVRRREWDRAEARAHLVHCVQVLSQRGAVVLTTRLDARRPGPLTSTHSARLRSRMQELNGIYDELHERFGTIHLDCSGHPDPAGTEGPGTSPSAAILTGRFARELARRGLEIPAAPGG